MGFGLVLLLVVARQCRLELSDGEERRLPTVFVRRLVVVIGLKAALPKVARRTLHWRRCLSSTAAATSSALIYVGILMLQGLKNVDFDDLDQVVPVFIMLLAMPISGSIGHGIGLAMISYTVIKVFSGKAKDVSALTYVITALFLVKFFAVV